MSTLRRCALHRAALVCLGLTPIALADDIAYTALRDAPFLGALGLQLDRTNVGHLVTLLVRPQSAQPGLRGIGVGVFPTSERAHEAVQFRMMVSAVAASAAPAGAPIGDEFLWWISSGDGHTSVLLRRANVVITFSRDGPAEAVCDLARQIDSLIRDNRDVAPSGSFGELPAIADAGIPAQAPKNSRLAFTPRFHGLGDPQTLRVRVVAKDHQNLTEAGFDGRSRPQIVVPGQRPDGLDDKVRQRTAAEDGRFILRVPDKVGPMKLTLIAVSPENVIVTKEVTLTVTE